MAKDQTGFSSLRFCCCILVFLFALSSIPLLCWSCFFELKLCQERLQRSIHLDTGEGNQKLLRVQYINTKEVRVTIGTWNVAGRLPDEDLDIDEWLCMNEPADIYILGFQEVVTLSAGNVLGAENRRPISKWETIIHQTLNRTTVEPEAKLKSYSAPP